MAPQHPKMRRPDPGHLKPYIESFAFSLSADGRSDRTSKIYTDALTFFAGWVIHHHGPIEWEQVGRDHIRGFFVWLHAPKDGEPCAHWLPPRRAEQDAEPAVADTVRPPCSGYGKGYINNLARCIQQFSHWLAEEEDIPEMFARVKVPSPPRYDENPVPVLTAEQLAALVRDAERSRSYADRRDAAILHLLRATGIRLAELSGLNLDDVALSERTATVTGKGGKTRNVRFDHAAVRAIDRYKRIRAKHPAAHLSAMWLGVRRKQRMTASGIYQMVAGRGRRLGIKVHPHMLRHGFVDKWLDCGGAEGDLMELTGWESTQMLQRYGRAVRSRRAQRSYDRVMGDA